MYTIEDTYEEINSLGHLVEDRIGYDVTGSIRAVVWKTVAAIHGRDEDLWCVRFWKNGEWIDTMFYNSQDRARVAFMALFENC